MTSVTFRKMNVDEILSITKQAGLDGIEWGGDLHVPAGAISFAEDISEKCRVQQIEILSYGSYYRAGHDKDFTPVLKTAIALGAKTIRVWAGKANYADTARDEYIEIVSHLKSAVSMAHTFQINIALEYHRGTLTEDITGTAAILNDVPGLRCYWQPNPDIALEEQLFEIDCLGSRLSNIHVFQWTKGDIAHPLCKGETQWRSRIEHINACPGEHHMIMEFVKGGTEAQFLEDAAILRGWAVE